MADSQQDAAPWRELLTAGYFPHLSLVCLGVWLHAADSLVVSTMIPAIVADIGGTALMHWTVVLYEIGSIVVSAACGLLVIKYGLRIPRAATALVFCLGCVISASASEMWVLLVGRLIQGLGGGGLVALSFVSVTVLFPARLVPRAMAAMSTLWGVSSLVGPLVGGLFVSYANWRAGFLFFAVQAFLLAVWMYNQTAKEEPHNKSTDSETFPTIRLAWLFAGFTLIALAGSGVPWLRALLLGVSGAAALIVFLTLDTKRGTSRLLPHNTISLSDPIGSGLTVVLLFAMSTIAISLYGPLLITRIHAVSVLTAGMLIAIESVFWTLAAVTVSGINAHHDRVIIRLGMTLIFISVAGLVYSIANGPLELIAFFSAMQGAGFGMAWVFILGLLNKRSPQGEIERVAAALPTMQRIGYALGATLLAIVANAHGLQEDGPIDLLQTTAIWIFASALPLAVLGLYATFHFTKTQHSVHQANQQ